MASSSTYRDKHDLLLKRDGALRAACTKSLLRRLPAAGFHYNRTVLLQYAHGAKYVPSARVYRLGDCVMIDLQTGRGGALVRTPIGHLETREICRITDEVRSHV